MLITFKDYLFLIEEVKTSKIAVFAFGRMNPFTKGHRKLLKKISSVAKEHNANGMIFLSHSHDKKKNPLTYEDKCDYVESSCPANVHLMRTPARNIFEIIDVLKKLKYKDFIFICGSDRINEFKSLIEKYKDDIDYNSFEFVSSGERDEDSDDLVTAISGTKMREYAKNGDIKNFTKAAGCKPELSVRMYNDVREGLGIKK